MQCKIGKVVGNLKALQLLLPETVDTMAVVQYMPTLLLSDMKKVSMSVTISSVGRVILLCMQCFVMSTVERTLWQSLDKLLNLDNKAWVPFWHKLDYRLN